MAFRAILFDLGGTLYDYRSLERGERECLGDLLSSAGVEAAPDEIQRRYRESLRRVFRDYLPRPFYLHRDLFRDAVLGAAESYSVRPGEAELERYWVRRSELHARDFTFRDGVPETLRALRRQGLHLGIVSNIDEDQLEHFVRVARLDEYFHSILSSERAGFCKPDVGIFTAALQRAGCAPEEAIFVGDSIEQDVAGANHAGLCSVLLWHRPDRDLPDREPRPRHVIRQIPELLAIVGGDGQ